MLRKPTRRIGGFTQLKQRVHEPPHRH